MAPALPEGTDPIVRKVQLTGGSTFSVSLPKDWAESQGLEAGSELRLYALDDRVVAAPTALGAEEDGATLAAAGVDAATLERRIRGAYRAGRDVVVVRDEEGLDRDKRRAATRTVGDLVGLEVVAADDSTVRARSVLDARAVSLDQTLAQLRRRATGIHEMAAGALAAADAELATTVHRQTEDVDRLVALVHRQFSRSLVGLAAVERFETDRATAFQQFRLARCLGDVADAAGALANLVPDDETGEPPPAVATAVRAAGESLDVYLAATLDRTDDSPASRRADLLAAIDDLAGAAGTEPPEAGRVGRGVARLRQAATAVDAVHDTVTAATDGAAGTASAADSV